jgi:predicted DsbA family dithiol-disulfide isomerase
MRLRTCPSLFLLTLGAWACTKQTACGPAANVESTRPGEIELHGNEPAEPAPPPVAALHPCLKDDPTGCSSHEDSGPRIVDGEQYNVEVLASDPSLGPADAPITLVLFSDFECPFCGRLRGTIEELRERYPTQLRIIWKDHPLAMHAAAMPAALLGREAYAQGGNPLFWQLHDRFFAEQSQLNVEFLQSVAAEHGLPWPPRSHTTTVVDASLAQAQKLGVRSTPTSFINGRAVVGAQPFDAFSSVIDELLASPGK